MRRLVRLLIVVLLATPIAIIASSPSGAQVQTTVTVVLDRQGSYTHTCDSDTVEVVAPSFTLTRSGDTSNALDVQVRWTEIGGSTSAGPSTLQFPAGAATLSVTPTFSGEPPSLEIMVREAAGYTPGDPAFAAAPFVNVRPPCVDPPVELAPTFTG